MNKRQVGSAYEEKAAQYLRENGYQILVRNFRCRQGEIDIIAAAPEKEGPCLVFVEVKYRKSQRTGLPEEAVTPAKARTICRTADFYRVRYSVPANRDCRFDVIAIQGETLRHYKNAFPYTLF